MTAPCLDEALQVGDYLPVATYRVTPENHRPGEGHARVEWLEHITAPLFARTCLRTSAPAFRGSFGTGASSHAA